MEIRTIFKKDLLEFANSEEFLNFENIPISQARAHSYANNPFSEDEDVVLLMIFENDRLIAYRNLFYDKLVFSDKELRFAWISGSWVHPDFRRKGYSKILLRKAYEVTQGKLMFSNYAPESHALYVESGLFVSVALQEGLRFYFRSCFAEVLTGKNKKFEKIKGLLPVFDFILNGLINFFGLLKKEIRNPEIFKENFPDEVHFTRYIELYGSDNAFKRSVKYFEFVLKFPWIKSGITGKKRNNYQFSDTVQTFEYSFIEQIEAGKTFFILKNRNGFLNLPYYFAHETSSEEIAKFIIHYAKKNKIKHFTSYFRSINESLLNYKCRFLFIKPIQTRFYATQTIAEIFEKEKLTVFPGDGDNIFT